MIVSALGKGSESDAFESGEPALDRYLQMQASQDQRAGVARCYVLHAKDSTEISGYYTLSAFALLVGEIPDGDKKKLPRYPHVPVTLLGRLAIARKAQGQGLGKLLVVDALARAASVRESIASWAVVVDPLNASAAHFYSKFGFRKCCAPESGDERMFLTFRDIEKNLDL